MGKTRKVFVNEARSMLEKIVAADYRVVWKLGVRLRRNRNRFAGEETPDIGEPSSCEAEERDEPLVLGCPPNLKALVPLHVEENVFDSHWHKPIALKCREEFLNSRFHNSFPPIGTHDNKEYTKK